MTSEFVKWAEGAVGHGEQEVTDAVVSGGGTVRVARRDGVPHVCSRDHVPNRANLTIENGIVTKITFG